MRAQYAKLEKTNNETNQNAKKVSEELKQVKEDFNLLLDINNTYKIENDKLKRRRSNLGDDECSDSNIKKIAKKKSKEKHDIYESDYDQHEEVNSTIDNPVRESNENKARVS